MPTGRAPGPRSSGVLAALRRSTWRGHPRPVALDIDTILDHQDGVISRRQAMAAGEAPHDVRRRLRRRDWVKVHPGVYVAHTGPMTWRQGAWAAVLWGWPAALWGPTALHAIERPDLRGATETVHIAIGRHRSGLRPPPGVAVHHVEGIEACVLWNTSPPRTRVEEAALDAAIGADSDLDAVAVLAQVIQRRWTTADRLLRALAGRRRVPRRRRLDTVLADLAAGTCSVLEHGFLTRVKRPHRLPRAERQLPARSSQGLVYRDATTAPCSSCWTAGSSTTRRRRGIGTSSATWTLRWTTGQRSASDGARCSSDRVRPPPSWPC